MRHRCYDSRCSRPRPIIIQYHALAIALVYVRPYELRNRWIAGYAVRSRRRAVVCRRLEMKTATLAASKSSVCTVNNMSDFQAKSMSQFLTYTYTTNSLEALNERMTHHAVRTSRCASPFVDISILVWYLTTFVCWPIGHFTGLDVHAILIRPNNRILTVIRPSSCQFSA